MVTIIDIIILLVIGAGIVDIYERVARAIKAHRQLKESSSKDSSSNSKELDELKDEIERLKEALKSHRHAPRRRSVGE